MGAFLSTQELRVVFESFDINRDGLISYQEMLETLRNNVTADRVACVEMAWN